MTPIITQTTDLKEYVSVNVNISFNTISPYLDAALLEFIEEPWLGADIIEDIETNVNTVTGLYPKIVPMMQKALTYFAIYKALPFLEVNIGDEGISRTESDRVATAYRGQVARIEKQLKTDAFNSLERLLNFLEKNKVDYPLWTSAPGYVEHSNYFFSSSQDFSYYYPIKNGRLTYNRILASMRYVTEFSIKSELGNDQFDDFFQKKFATNNTTQYVEAYRLLKNAIAHLTISQSLIDGWITLTEEGVHFTIQEKDIREQKSASGDQIQAKINEIEQRGQSYLAKLVSYMNDNLDDFIPFRDDTDVIKVDDDHFTGPGQIKGAFGA